MKKIVIEALYGEYSNLYGDRGNLLYVQEKLRRAGAEMELVQTHLFDRPAFADRPVDFLYIGPCTESQQEQELAHLRPYADTLRQRMEGDAVTLATGNAFELFGKAILCEDGREIDGLGFYSTTAKRFSDLRYNALCLGVSGEDKLVGFKNQLSHSFGETGSPFLTMETGTGLNPETKAEGFRRGNFIATYLLGPLLPLNPQFARSVLRQIAPEAEFAPLPYEEEAYRMRLEELSRPEANKNSH